MFHFSMLSIIVLGLIVVIQFLLKFKCEKNHQKIINFNHIFIIILTIIYNYLQTNEFKNN